ncbi:ATP-binding cassette domain-containing protein [candidate division KSB1 bacterium]|nr:ATP-binding cassette domain-containing protein [candidate division KSB1 bacterium]
MNYQEEEILGKAYDSQLMKRLLRFLKPYRFKVVLAILLLMGTAAANLIGPYLVKVAIDQHISTGNLSGLEKLVLLYLLILILSFLFTFTQVYMTQWIGQRVMYDIRMKIFSHLQHLPLSFFDKNPVGRIVTRTTNDVETLNTMLSSGIVSVFGDIFLLIGIIVVMINLDWRLALATFTVLPLLFYASMLFRIKVRRTYRDIRTRIAKINSYLQENITGMSVVQIFARESQNFKHFKSLNRGYLDAYLKTIHYYALFFPAVELISTIALALILWYGGIRILSNAVTIGVVVAFIQYAERFFHPIRDLSEKYNILQNAMASSERIFKLLDEPEQTIEPLEKLELPALKGEIEFQNVWFTYNGRDYVLRDASFKIKPGEKVAVVGSTGAGKTTLINLLTRMYEPTRGKILLDGIDITRLNVHDLRNRIRIVLQNVFIFYGSIQYNIRLGNEDITQEEIEQASKNVNAHDFISTLPQKYDTLLTEGGSNLSVGQKQLLSFARALVCNPEILVLDEATSSVDTYTEQLIQGAINNLMSGRTSLIIAHRLSTIKNVDWILVIHKGEIRETGTHEELIRKKGVYSRLYQLQYSLNV